jgi:Fe-S-cluster formation regulator IscX/YfhJ
MPKLEHERNNKSEKVWRIGAYNRRIDARSGDEFLSDSEASEILKEIQNLRQLEGRAYKEKLARLMASISYPSQKVFFQILDSQRLAKITQKDPDTIEMEVETVKGDPQRVNEKIILILETIWIYERTVVDPIVATLSKDSRTR